MMRSIGLWEGMKKMFFEGLDKLLVEKKTPRQIPGGQYSTCFPPAVFLQISSFRFHT